MEAESWEPVAPGRIENLTVVQSSTQSESSSAKQLFFQRVCTKTQPSWQAQRLQVLLVISLRQVEAESFPTLARVLSQSLPLTSF